MFLYCLADTILLPMNESVYSHIVKAPGACNSFREQFLCHNVNRIILYLCQRQHDRLLAARIK